MTYLCFDHHNLADKNISMIMMIIGFACFPRGDEKINTRSNKGSGIVIFSVVDTG